MLGLNLIISLKLLDFLQFASVNFAVEMGQAHQAQKNQFPPHFSSFLAMFAFLANSIDEELLLFWRKNRSNDILISLRWTQCQYNQTYTEEKITKIFLLLRNVPDKHRRCTQPRYSSKSIFVSWANVARFILIECISISVLLKDYEGTCCALYMHCKRI